LSPDLLVGSNPLSCERSQLVVDRRALQVSLAGQTLLSLRLPNCVRRPNPLLQVEDNSASVGSS